MMDKAMRKRFIDGEYAISDHAIIEARKDGIDPRTVEKLTTLFVKNRLLLLRMCRIASIG